jgi:transcription antitermination factor NusG
MPKKEVSSWVILEITSKGEEAATNGLLKDLLLENSPFKESDIFIPIVKHGSRSIWMMEGYIFIKSGYSTSDYYDLKRTYLVSNIVSQVDSRTGLISVGVIESKDLNHMLKKADELGAKFDVGDRVKIIEGEFTGFEAEVVSLFKKENLRMYTLLIKMRSVEIITSANCLSVEAVDYGC